MEEIRIARDDWPEKCKELHREGYSIKQMHEDKDGLLVVGYVRRTELRGGDAA